MHSDRPLSQSEPRYRLGSVDNALTLVRCLGRGHAIRVADAARELDVAQSTAHRLLAMLEFRGFARQNHVTKAYLPGPALAGCSEGVVAGPRLENVSKSELRSLAERYNVSAHVAVLRRFSTHYLTSLACVPLARLPKLSGTTYAAENTAAGRALLAELESRQVEDFFVAAGEARSETRRNYDRLFADLAEVRSQGYALVLESPDNGVNEIAVAIKRGAVHGALALTGPSDRFTRNEMRKCTSEMKRAAHRIAAYLEPA
jgi:DNA-binding IclR family transcriptional regulator